MHAQTTAAPTRGLARLDATIILLIILLSLISLAVWYSPGFPGVEDARALDIAINVAAIMIGAAVAILAWIRWRDTGESVALYESSAFVALTAINVLMTGIVILGKESAFGLDASQPGVAPIYVWTHHPRRGRRDPGHRGGPQPASRGAPAAAAGPRHRACGHPRAVRRSCCSGGRRSCRRCPVRRPSIRPAAASSGRRRSRPGSCSSRSRSSSASSWPPSSCAGSTSGTAWCRTGTSRRAWSSPRSASCISPWTRSSRRGS